jgi:hypothetical protein
LANDVQAMKNTLSGISGVNIDKLSAKISSKIAAGAYDDE